MVIVKNFELNEKTMYLIGVILGDGNISNYFRGFPPTSELDPRITMECGNEEFLREIVKPIVDDLIKRNCKLIERKPRTETRNSTWILCFRSKYFHKYLTEDLGLPKGKKAGIISIEKLIEKTNPILAKYLIAGLFDTDGGLRGNCIGFCSASKVLRDEMTDYLKKLGLRVTVSQWTNKKYQKVYYEWQIKEKLSIRKFVEIIPLRNLRRLNAIKERFL